MKKFAVTILALFGLAAAVQACPPPVAIVQQQAVVYQQPVALLQTFFVPTVTTYAVPQFQAQANVYSSMVNVQANVQARACAKGCGARRGILRRGSVTRARSVIRMR